MGSSATGLGVKAGPAAEGAADSPAPRPRMGRRRREDGPALSRDRLIEAVMRLAETEGESAINMRRVAAELGVSSRLLYRHIRDKAELLDLVAEAITKGIRLPPPSLPWDERLLQIARATRREVRRYPGAPYRTLVNSTQSLDPAPVRHIEGVIAMALREAGLDEEQARNAYMALSSFSMGHLMVSQAYASGAESAERMAFTPEQLEASFEAGFKVLLEGIRAAGRDGAAGR